MINKLAFMYLSVLFLFVSTVFGEDNPQTDSDTDTASKTSVLSSSAEESTAQESKEQGENAGFRLLPNRDLFKPLVAEPREAQFSARYEQNNITIFGEPQSFSAAAVSFGDYLPVFEYERESGDILQFSIDGAMYALFNLDAPSWDLINTDYMFGFSLAYEYEENWSARLRLFHVSSHLGDEFVLANPDVERENASYEDIELLVAYSTENWRFYGGGASIIRSNSLSDLDPLRVRGGIEYRRPVFGKTMDVLVALNLDSKQRSDWRIGRSVMAGLALAKSDAREVRFMANYYRGPSVQGQFFRESLEYFGLGLYFIV